MSNAEGDTIWKPITPPFIADTEKTIGDWSEKVNIQLKFEAILQHLDFNQASIAQEIKTLEYLTQTAIRDAFGDLESEESQALYSHIFYDGAGVFNYEYSGIHHFEIMQWHSEFLFIYSYFEYTLTGW
ncbi:hypothetical protein [Methylomonas sp. DH-1]|uniref:hypothetical protein n=1 Tax=Methylomonas sp. (strain DH-1) TaxID=1727196 RepID=UPI0007C8D5DE|nr:hypothetical protein [Methylomonas sp. DH-1]ANE54267.1 hypothetical protein AYM39_03075 [Methylomonas sp. DH-1]